jgi:hypothetical protein
LADEITEIVNLYLQDSDVLENKIKEIQLYLDEQTKLSLNEGMNSYRPKYLDLPEAQQYQRTGHTMDSIRSDYEISGLTGTVRGYLSQDDYTKFVDVNSIWGGYEFFKGGLEATMNLYG